MRSLRTRADLVAAIEELHSIAHASLKKAIETKASGTTIALLVAASRGTIETAIRLGVKDAETLPSTVVLSWSDAPALPEARN